MLRREDFHFAVDEDKKKVAVWVEGTQTYFIDFALDELPQFSDFIVDHFEELEMKSRYVATATCGENDEWDEEIGKLIAYDRVKEKLNISFFKRAKKLTDLLDKEVNKFVDTVNLYGTKLTVNTKRRKNIINQKVGE